MQNCGKIYLKELLIAVIFICGFHCLSCKRSIPNENWQTNLNDNQRVTINEPVCAPSRTVILKGNVYLAVDTLPEFPGGNGKFMEFVETHLKYPAKAHGASGRVNVTFVINRNGNLSDSETVGRKMHPAFEKEALRIMRASPKWRPGKPKGKKVRTLWTVPIVFLPPPALPSYHRPE
jgi:TonB family protein